MLMVSVLYAHHTGGGDISSQAIAKMMGKKKKIF